MIPCLKTPGSVTLFSVKPLHHLDHVFYPLGGMGYLVSDLGDLFQHKLSKKEAIRLCFSAQPNSHPHLGTVMSVMVLYAIGEHLRERFGIPVFMQFDKGEHCVGEKKVVNGILYSKSLQDTLVDGISAADYYMKSFEKIFRDLSKRTSIPYKIKNYTQLQADPIVRKTMLQIIQNREKFIPILSPSTKKLHLRFPCPICRFADKHAYSQRFEIVDSKTVKVINRCFEHGDHSIIIKEDNQDFFDINTALYDLLLGVFYLDADQHEKTLTIMIDGGDYAGVWPMLIHGEALLELGYRSIPNRLFAPLILDWSGAKFSKSLYVKHGAYAYLPKGLIDFSKFYECYGEEGFDRLWQEAQEWASSPVKFFRNYSVDYFRLILGSGKDNVDASANPA